MIGDVCVKKVIVVLITIILISLPSGVYARRGCCSHHGGVSGCNSSGCQVCNDGTLSPSCTCTPTRSYIYGCMDKEAKNYNPKADKSNGNCIYFKKGCTDKNANNYDSTAEKDDGSCTYYVYGCMDRTAKNYNADANRDDNSCEYETVTTNNEITNKNDDNSDTSSGILGCFLGIGYVCGVAFAVFKAATKRKKV